MALTDFFRINMPYGMKKNPKNEWFVFNREYMPLGWNNLEYKKSIFIDEVYAENPLYTKYKGLTEQKLVQIITDPTRIQRNASGEIEIVFFYNAGSNPQTNPQNWDSYIKLMGELSKLEQK